MEQRKSLATISEDADFLTKQAFYQVIRENGGPDNFDIIVRPAREERLGKPLMSAQEFVSRLSPELLKNMQWSMEHWGEFGRYEGQFIGIVNQQVYCSGNTREDVKKRIVEDGFSLKDVIIDYVDDFSATYLN